MTIPDHLGQRSHAIENLRTLKDRASAELKEIQDQLQDLISTCPHAFEPTGYAYNNPFACRWCGKRYFSPPKKNRYSTQFPEEYKKELAELPQGKIEVRWNQSVYRWEVIDTRLEGEDRVIAHRAYKDEAVWAAEEQSQQRQLPIVVYKKDGNLTKYSADNEELLVAEAYRAKRKQNPVEE